MALVPVDLRSVATELGDAVQCMRDIASNPTCAYSRQTLRAQAERIRLLLNNGDINGVAVEIGTRDVLREVYDATEIMDMIVKEPFDPENIVRLANAYDDDSRFLQETWEGERVDKIMAEADGKIANIGSEAGAGENAPPLNGDEPLPTLSDDGILVLTCLQNTTPRRLRIVDIANKTRIGEKTVRSIVKYLLDAGYSARPKGRTRGELSITKSGNEFLASLKPPVNDR